MKLTNLFRLVPIAVLSVVASVAYADTYAVCIGINEYAPMKDGSGNPIKDEKGQPINHNLNGAVNDAKTYVDLLTAAYGVPEKNIKMLTDSQANEDGFIAAVKWLLSNAKAGDQVFFQFSGHGTQFDSKEEADGKQEAIVLQDYTLVPGNLFNKIASALSSSGIQATFVFDSCFSGGMSRDPSTYGGKAIVASKKRFIVMSKAEKSKFKVSSKASLPNLKSAIKAPKALQSQGQTLFVFAGGENQTTSDIKFKDPSLEPHGLFTLVFAAMLADGADKPIQEVVGSVGKFIKDKGFSQVPGLEASSKDRLTKPLVSK